MYLSGFIYCVEGVGPRNVRPIKTLGPSILIVFPACLSTYVLAYLWADTIRLHQCVYACCADRARMAGKHQPDLPFWYCSTFTNCAITFSHRWMNAVAQRFPIPVLAPPPPPPPPPLPILHVSLNTHLIQITSSLEESYVHELCSDWHAPFTVSIAPYSLSRGNPLKFISLRNIHSWICAAQHLHTQTKLTRDVWGVTEYTSVNKYNLNSHLAHFNALCMNKYARFELESWQNTWWCPLRRAHMTYGRTEPSDVIRYTVYIYIYIYIYNMPVPVAPW